MVLLIFILFILVVKADINNVCPTYVDYYIRDISDKCWLNTDIGLPVVSKNVLFIYKAVSARNMD